MAKTIDVRCDKTGVIFDVSTKRIFVEDVKTLTNGQIAVLECGDFVVKQTGNQKHTYKVTYKEENVGLCITYEDATIVETVSYDWNGEKWVYNSTDISNIDGGSGTTVVANPTLTGGEAELTGLEVDGTKYAVPSGSGGGTVTLDDIVDSAGNKRFVEGNGTPTDITQLTLNYNKWSLSGTHLMLVVSGQVNTSFTTLARNVLTTFELPEYIYNKIVGTNVERKEIYFFSSDITQTNVRVLLQKTNTNLLKLVLLDEKALTQFQTFRIQFDLLIDAS